MATLAPGLNCAQAAIGHGEPKGSRAQWPPERSHARLPGLSVLTGRWNLGFLSSIMYGASQGVLHFTHT